MRTGDAGCLDDRGRLHLRGRLKDMIKTGGENVHASEVEAALCSHSAVAAAAVVAVPHDRLGETVGAVIVLREGFCWSGPVADTGGSGADGARLAGGRGEEAVGLEQLQAHCRGRGGLAGFKVPRVAAATGGRAPLPANAMGKVLKDRVRLVRSDVARS